MSITPKVFIAVLHGVLLCTATRLEAVDRESLDRKVQPVIDDVDKLCRAQTVYMIGPEKAKRLAELIREKKPKLVVECGTAIGYSGLWIARELKATGHGKLVTIEIDQDRVKQARANFEKAGLSDVAEVRLGDARELAGKIEGPVDFVFIDCNYSNYHPCFQAIDKQLAPGATVVADNVGIGASGMKDYLDHVRSNYSSKTEWFDIDLPWGSDDLGLDFVDRELKTVHAGHLCIARVTLKRLTITDSKTGHMDLKIRERRLAGEKSPELTKLMQSNTASFPLDLQADQWYTLLVVVDGDVMRVSLNGKPIGEFQSEGIAHPTKRMITLAVNKSAWVDDVKVWKRK